MNVFRYVVGRIMLILLECRGEIIVMVIYGSIVERSVVGNLYQC